LRGLKAISSLFVFYFLLFNPKTINPESPKEKIRQEGLQEEVTVTLKLIQVYVTDKKGKPVTDLEQSEFELYDNGKPKKITDFERHILALPDTATKIQQVKTKIIPPRKMSRKFFFFFDFAFNNVGGITMAKRAAQHFIDTQVLPTDQVGILSYSTHNGLMLYEYLTTEHEKIRDVIKDIGLKETLGRAGQLMEDLEGEKWPGDRAVQGDETWAKQVQKAREDSLRIGGKMEWKYQARLFSSALKDLAQALRYIPGQKNIILFSVGVPNFMMYPRSDSTRSQLNRINYSLSDSTDLRNRYEKMHRELETANSPVYAVNVEGVFADFMEREGGTKLSRSLTREFEPDSGIADWDRRGDKTLREMASNTGGKYFGDINDYKKIVEEIHTHTGSYYVLGYYIDEKWNGKYHRVKVKVKRKGCKAYGQGGYYNPKPFTKFSPIEKKLHLVDLAFSESPHFGIPVRFPITTLSREIENRSMALVYFKASAAMLSEIIGEKNEIVFLAFDEKRNIVALEAREIESPKIFERDAFTYAVLPLYSGKFDCRVVIRNLETGRGAVGASTIIIPSSLEKGIRLYSPLVLVPGDDSLYFDIAHSVKIEETKEYSSFCELYPFDPYQYLPLIGNVKRGTPEIAVLIPCSAFGIKEANIKIFACCIRQSTGEKIPLDFRFEQKNGVFFLKVLTGRLDPDKYSLYLFAEETNTLLKAHKQTMFSIGQ
jgi:VWFA-related protein